ncbi:aldose epimerase [Flavobacterium akiainvivens]|uniref:Aldose epimerase n=1 Tax=Flavobacterium akiainvivens TaxID=1202724 RepID=A0A0M9VHE8_9FLAO|nr:aldose 1-epimerase family protein [Flavobacterium akiainvivens]KOS05490.1 aldose epimerase [Flavobacterium akiainvivens]SFQ32981.1 Galactose mutarotase [Flavobacterium akiainvivens]
MENITLSNGILTATINPKGAELNSLKNNNTEYIWEGNAKYWGKHSPVLFPIVGTLKNNSYLYNGQPYALSRHGFARDNVFTVKGQNENSVTFSLSSNEETKKVYPFDFELQLVYTLNQKSLEIKYNVINKGAEPLPFSIGAHPAFALPGNFESYSLVFEKEEPLASTQLENDLIGNTSIEIATNGNVLPLNYGLFANDALIFKTLTSNAITIAKDNEPVLKVNFTDFPHLGIWTKEDAPFICIEPWQGYSDATNSNGIFKEKEGIIILPENETFTAAFTIEILKGKKL